jgi:hypothetical protein
LGRLDRPEVTEEQAPSDNPASTMAASGAIALHRTPIRLREIVKFNMSPQ